MNSHFPLTYKMWESRILTQPRLRLYKDIDLDQRDKEWVSMIKWSDISWEAIGGDGNNIHWLEMNLPLDTDIAEGVVVDLHMINNTFNQLHVSMTEDLRGLGLGTNIYISLINELGHIYSGIGRRTNPLITRLIESLSNRSDIIHVKNSLGDLLVSVDFDMKDELIEYFKNI